MSVTFSGELFGGLSVRLTHEPSGSVIETTPPVDNGGNGSKFSPTDLCAASLGACGASVMAIYAKNHNIPLEKIAFKLSKHMQKAPRRIAQIVVDYEIKTSASDADYAKILQAARTCPVRHSLGEQVDVVENFRRI